MDRDEIKKWHDLYPLVVRSPEDLRPVSRPSTQGATSVYTYICIHIYMYIYIYIYIPTILAAYKPRSAGTFRITGHVVTYPSRISLPLSASLVVHSRGTGGVISVTYAPRLKSR